MTFRRIQLAPALLVLVLLSCKDKHGAPSPTPIAVTSAEAKETKVAAVDAGLSPSGLRNRPKNAKELPTTDGVMALENLDAQIAGAEAVAKKDPKNFHALHTASNLHVTRGKLRGDL